MSRTEAPAGSQDLLDTADAGTAAIRGGALRLIGYAAGVIVTVTSAALLFRHLGVADGGRYVTVTSLALITSGILDFGLTTIVVRELAVLAPAEGRRLMRNLVGLRIALSVVAVGAAVAFAALAGYPGVMVLGALLAGIGTAMSSAQGLVAGALIAELRLGWVTLLELLRQVVVAVTIITLVVAGAALLPFLATPISAGIAVLGLTALLVRGRVPIRPAFDRAAWWQLLRQLLPFAAATALATAYFRISVVLLSLVSSARETGLFGAPFRVVETLLVIPNLLVSAGFPIFARAARDDRARLAYAVQRLFEVCTLAGGWVALVLVVGAPVVIDVVAGSKFPGSADVLRLQAAALFAAFSGSAFGYALLSLRRHGALLGLTGSALVANCVLVPVLGSLDGARGAALATLGAELVLAVGGGVMLAQVDSALRPRLHVLGRLLPAFGIGAATLLIPGLPDVAAMVLASIVYIALALLLRAVPDEVLVELRALARLARRPPRPSQ